VQSAIRLGTATILAVSIGVISVATRAPQAPAAAATESDWPSYGRDLGNARYSPLERVTRENAATLRIAWRWRSDNFSQPPEYRNESTPIMVNGTLYFTTGVSRWVIAADALTGATKWAWHLD
jgi:glucose dehydrogenase